MFGGLGIYLDDLFVALVFDDVLYCKADESNKGDYTAKGMTPFTYTRGNKIQSLQFYELPVEILEDDDSLKKWLNKSLTVAKRKKAS